MVAGRFGRPFLARRSLFAAACTSRRVDSCGIESLALDANQPELLVSNGGIPGPSPDGDSVAFVQTTSAGTGLMLWSRTEGSLVSLVPFRQFTDIAYPRFSLSSDQIAFPVPEKFLGDSPHPDAACGWFFRPCVALAHGSPWNLWLVRPDGTNAHELAKLEADDGSVAWSPDGSQLLVYGGSGGYIVDANSGEFQELAYLSGTAHWHGLGTSPRTQRRLCRCRYLLRTKPGAGRRGISGNTARAR
jgi:Tol biopolymer transport system component